VRQEEWRDAVRGSLSNGHVNGEIPSPVASRARKR
jgi:hypothetical protein